MARGAGFGSKESRLYMTSGGLSAFLKSLPIEFRRDIAATNRAWGKAIRDDARARAPVAEAPIKRRHGTVTQPGTLREAISFGLFLKGMGAVVGIYGRRRRKAWYAHFLEYGTKPHSVSEGGGMVAGTPEHPFLRPAAQVGGPAWARAMIPAIRQALQKAAASGRGGGQLLKVEDGLRQLESNVAALKRSDVMAAPSGGVSEEG